MGKKKLSNGYQINSTSYIFNPLSLMKTWSWIVFGFLAIGVGLYPVHYFVLDMSQGLLSSKPPAILKSQVWNFLFYQHIIFGGLALLTGWSQFSRKVRSRYISIHRMLGKVYVISCLLSGMAGFYLAFHATGGWVATLGFGGLALSWLFATSKAFVLIRQKQITSHQEWMLRSYALTFAAVTLRIWLPLGQILQYDFVSAYLVISWLCWVPNLAVAEWLVRRRRPLALLR
jgi:predicted membrane protein DUF2306